MSGFGFAVFSFRVLGFGFEASAFVFIVGLRFQVANRASGVGCWASGSGSAFQVCCFGTIFSVLLLFTFAQLSTWVSPLWDI